MTKIERFFQKVYPEPNTGCWLWAGAALPSYGHGTLSGASYGFFYAHRFSYFIHKGDFDRSKLVCHTCDVPWCVNPDHLYLGTLSDNMNDKVSRGRQMRGEKCTTRKFNNVDIIEIRRLAATGMMQKEICKIFNADDGLISLIINRKRWKHI